MRLRRPPFFSAMGTALFQPPIGSLNISGVAAVADLNGDGIPDLAAIAGTQLSVALGKGNEHFYRPHNTPSD